MKIKLLFSVIILLISCQTNGQEKQVDYTLLISKFDSIISNHNFNGVISLSSDATDIYSKTIGFSDLENKTKITFTDQFVIGSISKQITALLILQEYEKGKIKLDDTVDKYLTKINQAWVKKVTIHQLLTHTHGIIDLEKPLEFKQGTQFHYSQLGYELLALILQNVTGKNFEKLSTKLFKKYGLKNTFHPYNKKYKNLVKGYEENQNGILEFASNSLDNYAPAGSLISNATDLKKWNKLLYSGQLVTQETLQLMTTKYTTRIHPIFDAVQYGYGLLFKEGEKNVQIGALGYAPGFVSACYYYPQNNISLIILENTATNLDDFKQTFIVHTELMELIKAL